MEIKPLNRADYNKIISFMIKGMNLESLGNSPSSLRYFSRYYLYYELNRATDIICAYEGDEILGILIGKIKDKPKIHSSFSEKFYVHFTDFVDRILSPLGDPVEKAMMKLCKEYEETYDGEITFLTKDPDCDTKGIGTFLLNEFESRCKGKTIFLFTDDGCTYQFYEHRGFERVFIKNIVMKNGKKDIPVECYIYKKHII